MIKIKFENLLVSIVVSVVVFFNTISTTMLDRTFFQVKVNFLFLVVLLLGLRFLYKMRVSYKYLILSILLLLSGVLVYFQTNRLNFLVYSMLLVLLVNVDMKVVLRNYVVVAGILVVGVFFYRWLAWFLTCSIIVRALFEIRLGLFILRTLHHIASIYF
ncbi:hypothetical protein HMPREF9954_0532 [Streptococcus infantis SK970]|nr:hypothetical protein HMPREF9954_0532 [Streptococcus infantis SK970]